MRDRVSRSPYAELDEWSNRLAQRWHAAGLRTVDGVAMLITNISETLEFYCWK